MSRNIINLGLLAIVVILATIVIWEPGQQTDITTKLSSLSDKDINRIHIQRDGLQDVQLEKSGDHWNMLTPYSIPADENRIKALLALVNTRSYTRFSAEDRKLSDYGLESSLAQVKFNDSLFQLGKLEHISKRRYISTNSDIHLITDLFYHQLRTSAAQFVSTQLFSPEQRITRLNMTDSQYEQKHDGSWLMSPENKSISADQINSFIENWQRLRATRVSLASDATSTERIHLVVTSGKEMLFEIVRNEDELIFIRRDLGLQYHIPSQLAETLFTVPTADALQKF